jgi:hypothetical protein
MSPDPTVLCPGCLHDGVLERTLERARTAEAKLAAIRECAEAWAALAPADDWGLTPADTVAADCGRAILAIISGDTPATAEQPDPGLGRP